MGVSNPQLPPVAPVTSAGYTLPSSVHMALPVLSVSALSICLPLRQNLLMIPGPSVGVTDHASSLQ